METPYRVKSESIKVSFNFQRKNLVGVGIGLGFWGLYVIATFLHEGFWGLHHLAFLNPAAKIIYLFTSILFVLSGFVSWPSFEITNRYKWFFAIVIPIICGLVYYHLPFAASLTGDAELFNQKLGASTAELYPVFVEKLLSPNIFHPKTGNTTVLSGIRLISYYFDISHHQAYRWLGVCSGTIFIFLWLILLRKLKLSDAKFGVGLTIGVMAPFTQFFFGYEEIYAPAYPVLLAFLYVHLLSYRAPKIKWILVQLALVFLCMKLHSVFVLLIPSAFLSIAFLVGNKHGIRVNWFSWRNMFLFVLLPITTFGLFTYFFIAKDFNDPRFVSPDVDIYERLFLPLLSPAPPLDRYNLFSVNHIIDYFNMLFQWFGGGLLVAVILIVTRTNIKWDKPEMISIGLSCILFLMIFFVYNPLMSMPYDFDLFSIPGPVFLTFILLILTNSNGFDSKQLIGPVLGICLLTLPIFQVNASTSALSYRLESVGKHVFKTYWIRSAGDIRSAVELTDNVDDKIDRYTKTVAELKPHANADNDTEFANLLFDLAKLHRTSKQDYQTALTYHEMAKSYDSTLIANYIGLMEANYMLENYRQAFEYSEVLVTNNFPSEQEALKIAIECSYQAKEFDATRKYCEVYLDKWNDQSISLLLEQF